MPSLIQSGGSGGAVQSPLHPRSCSPQYLLSLMPKQLAHSSRAMYLSLSRSQASKNRVVQCSMGIRGARSGASSVWDRYLPRGTHHHSWPQLSGWAAVPVPSQHQPLSVTKARDWCLPLQPAVLVTKQPPAAGGPCRLPPPHRPACVITLMPISSSQLSQQLPSQLLQLSRGLWTKIF